MPFNLTALFDGLAGCPGVAIAVSGGSDSMALVRLARAWNGAPLMALTVDHGLRAGSADEARQVKAWCDAIGVAHKVLTWRGPKPASGLQAAARQARYSLMAEDCRAHGLPVLLTGHTLEDQAETVAMRARRTQSVVSLAGIWPETQWNGVTVRRPLLALRRAALRGWLQDLGQGWIDDPSNNDQRFERVRVRKAMAEGDVAALASRADAARRDAASLSVAVDAWITQHVTRHPEGHLTFAREDAVAAAVPLRRVVLARLVRQVGGSAGLEMAELDRLSAAIAEGRKVTLGGAVMAPRGGAVWLAREAGRIPQGWSLVGEEGVLAWDGRYRVHAPPGSAVGPVALAQGLKRPQGLPFFVFEGLPAVRLADGTCVPALDGKEFAVSAALL